MSTRAAGMLAGYFQESLGDPGIVGILQQQLRKRIVAVRIEAGRDQHHFGAERIERRQYRARHAEAELARSRQRPQGHVDDAADLRSRSRAPVPGYSGNWCVEA